MTIDPIATVRSCFGSKFAVPRQPGLCPSAWGRLVFHPAYRSPEAVRGIEGFSHLWLIFGFHETVEQGWKPTVRPPRLGGNQRIGVFASRSTFRPNGLGLSLVRLEGIDTTASDSPVLLLGGLDLLDGTPVYDVKPYLPYAEAVPEAAAGFAGDAIARLAVEVDAVGSRRLREITGAVAGGVVGGAFAGPAAGDARGRRGAGVRSRTLRMQRPVHDRGGDLPDRGNHAGGSFGVECLGFPKYSLSA